MLDEKVFERFLGDTATTVCAAGPELQDLRHRAAPPCVAQRPLGRLVGQGGLYPRLQPLPGG